MALLHCHNCGNKIAVPKYKYQLIGLGIAGFGVFGWFSFLFAGSGHAFLIACGIFFVGIGIFCNAEKIAMNSLKDKPCPSCGSLSLNENEKFIDVTPSKKEVINRLPIEENFHFSDEKNDDNLENCPRCGVGILQKRHGRYGPFWGCSRYPKCRYTKDA